MGVITHFCTCCFIFQLFLQLIEEKGILNKIYILGIILNYLIILYSEGYHFIIIYDCLCL
uniref:Photosystem II protein L n=1 Tax=Cercis chuniana TaxID=161752 RepID=A0A3Q8G2V8_9FABA|nr:photosystem II protein L [Cercis chuniana]